jgi:transcriptional regulator with XRE-family HTH domain
MTTNAKKFLEKLNGQMTVAKALSAIMAREEITQGDLANILGVNKSYISNIMSGRKKISIDKAVEIADLLDEPPTTLIEAAINDALNEALENSDLHYEVVLKAV